MNKVFLLGNVVAKPELRYTPSGMAVTDLRMAIDNRRKSGNDWIEDTLFLDVTLFGKSAENSSQYLDKGRQVLVEGKLILDKWEDNGEKRSRLRVYGDSIQFLQGNGKKKEEVSTNTESNTTPATPF